MAVLTEQLPKQSSFLPVGGVCLLNVHWAVRRSVAHIRRLVQLPTIPEHTSRARVRGSDLLNQITEAMRGDNVIAQTTESIAAIVANINRKQIDKRGNNNSRTETKRHAIGDAAGRPEPCRRRMPARGSGTWEDVN
ncbi:hypothetical protein LSAT2_005030 [Lamellibrachia satsuma]|nr:hypothetical protein LSAT2_005030 [Lamellibrachia satsuma]